MDCRHNQEKYGTWHPDDPLHVARNLAKLHSELGNLPSEFLQTIGQSEQSLSYSLFDTANTSPVDDTDSGVVGNGELVNGSTHDSSSPVGGIDGISQPTGEEGSWVGDDCPCCADIYNRLGKLKDALK